MWFPKSQYFSVEEMLNSVQRECILCEASLNSKLILMLTVIFLSSHGQWLWWTIRLPRTVWVQQCKYFFHMCQTKFCHCWCMTWTFLKKQLTFFFLLQFKESALRKQSLYLKFDPLLRESPKKSGGPAAQMSHVPRPASFVSQYDVLLFSLSLIAAVTAR